MKLNKTKQIRFHPHMHEIVSQELLAKGFSKNLVQSSDSMYFSILVSFDGSGPYLSQTLDFR